MLQTIEQLADQASFLDFELKQDEDGQVPSLFAEWPLRVTPDQIETLERNGNRARNWASVRISPRCDLGLIRRCVFEEDCLIGDLSGPAIELIPGVSFSPGLEDSRLSHAIVSDGCCVRAVELLSRTDVLKRSVVASCGLVSGGDLNPLGLNREIVFAPGSGGRQLPVLPGMTSAQLAWLAERMDDAETQRKYREICAHFRKRRQRSTTLIAEGARVYGAKRILRSAIGPHACVYDASAIEDCVLLSSREAPTKVGTNVILKQVTANEGVEIRDGAYAENCHFCEASGADGNARVTSSIIAPNTSILCGECRSSFVGPFVAFRHQALLIASYWPGGRGNISYGANVGSNNTGKAPDQEHWGGEGVFYGLDSVIKYPANYAQAPYTIIASGVVTLPQRVRYPFSLINQRGTTLPSLSPAINEIRPGWVITKNIYGLFWLEKRHAELNKARREVMETRVFRPSLIPMLLDAYDRLNDPEGGGPAGEMPDGETFYLREQLPGIGKNFLLERHRLAGINAYEFALQLILARTIFEDWIRFEGTRKDSLVSPQLAEVGEDVLQSIPGEFVTGATWGEALDAGLPYLEHAAGLAQSSKQRDELRGTHIIPDYPAVHGATKNDPIIVQLQANLAESRRLAKLDSPRQAASGA